MRCSFGGVLLIAGFMLVPATVVAQQDEAMHEVGVDLGMFYQKPSSNRGVFNVGTPIDVRLGIPIHGWTLEPRVGFTFQSSSIGSAHDVNLDLNAVLPVGSGSSYRKGMYLTAGGGLDFKGGNVQGFPSPDATLAQLNAGIGTRVPYGPAAIRVETYMKYHFRDRNIGYTNTFDIGVRVGLSLWH